MALLSQEALFKQTKKYINYKIKKKLYFGVTPCEAQSLLLAELRSPSFPVAGGTLWGASNQSHRSP